MVKFNSVVSCSTSLSPESSINCANKMIEANVVVAYTGADFTAEAALPVYTEAGLPWVTTNTDLTLPTDDGLAPGHGLLVRLISEFAEVTPQVAGKPERPLLDETRLRVEGERPLMVGDRLDTDIAGAHEAEVDSLLVMTGVSTLRDLLAAGPAERPTWLGRDLTALFRPGCTAHGEDGRWRAGPWTAGVDDGRLVATGSGTEPAEADAWWTAVAAAGWDHLDRTGSPADPGDLTGPGEAARPG